jgi:broad specificity phosphatase PhoE
MSGDAHRASAGASDSALTTVFVVRHAEKNVVFAGADPPLSDAGLRRAQALARVLGEAGVKAILSTDFVRTRDTARPLAQATGDSITIVSEDDPGRLAGDVWRRYRGEAVLIIGHSDTVPSIVRSLTGVEVPAYREGEFDRLYVIIRHGLEAPHLLRLHYGEGTSP